MIATGDSDNDEVDAVTGTCLAASVSLPSGILQIKKYKDANADRPAKVCCLLELFNCYIKLCIVFISMA